MRLLAALLALLLALAAPGAAAQAPPATDAALWKAIAAGDHVVLMRHATAPGVGDPAGFRLRDCATQRNLSAEGRRQAHDIGDRFRAHGVGAVQLLSSQWCRCLDTAQALRLGAVGEEPALNSFFADSGTADAQTAAVRALIRARLPGATLVLVTHQVNITALTDVVPASGEMLVMRPDGDALRLVGRLR